MTGSTLDQASNADRGGTTCVEIILVLIIAVIALIAAIQLNLLQFTQDRPAEVPGVEVTSNGITATGGQTPTFEVQTGTVAVGTRNATRCGPGADGRGSQPG